MLIPDDSSVRISQSAGQPLLVWPSVPERVHLKPRQVHIWAANTSDFESHVVNLAALLAPEEEQRARGFKFASDHDRFVIRRGLLRVILGRYLGKAPTTIEFHEGKYGKPTVRTGSAKPPLCFNTSHSDGIAVFAFTSVCPIGVDVEYARPIPDIEILAKRFFTARETRTLSMIPPETRLGAFYACWTRKEAYLKATGEGIAENLASVEVTLRPNDSAQIVSVSGEPHANEQWQLQPFTPARSYVGCIAYRNARLELSEWKVESSSIKW